MEGYMDRNGTTSYSVSGFLLALRWYFRLLTTVSELRQSLIFTTVCPPVSPRTVAESIHLRALSGKKIMYYVITVDFWGPGFATHCWLSVHMSIYAFHMQDERVVHGFTRFCLEHILHVTRLYTKSANEFYAPVFDFPYPTSLSGLYRWQKHFSESIKCKQHLLSSFQNNRPKRLVHNTCIRSIVIITHICSF